MFSSCAVGSIIPSVEIRNITAVGDFGCEFNLDQLYSWLPHAYVKQKKQNKSESQEKSKESGVTKKKKRKLGKCEREVQLKQKKTEREAQLKLKERLPLEVKYDKNAFKGLTLRILYPVKATLLLFHTGKVVCIGTKSLTELLTAGHYFTHILFLHGYQPVFSGFTVKNMVSSWSSGGRLKVEQLYAEHGGIYEPELFPALLFYVGNVTLLIFHSGKVVATGARRHKELNIAHEKISSILNTGYYFG